MQNCIKARREALNLSQQDLAGAMNVDRITIWRWESGKITPDLVIAAKLGQVLKIAPYVLFPALADTAGEAAHV